MSLASIVTLILALMLASCSGGGSSSGARRTTTSTAPTTTTTVPVTRPAPPADVYAYTRAGMISPVARLARPLVYVPESGSNAVDVIDPSTLRVIAHYMTGARPQHVVPSWDLRTLYVANNIGNSLTPIDPNTGRPSGPNIPVEDPYNLYFEPNGTAAIVVAERRARLDFRDPHTFALQTSLPVQCAGVDHLDFSADGSYLIASCEFAGRLVKVDLRRRTVVGYLNLPGSSPQDVKVDPGGRLFYVADMNHGGVYLIDGLTFRQVGFIPTGRDAHGLYPSRDGTRLYVSNRRGGSITVINFATRSVIATWPQPGATPDMGGVSADGSVLWLSGRFSNAVYAISTVDGHRIATISVPHSPHGLCVWPQPGRFSIGHTGVMR